MASELNVGKVVVGAEGVVGTVDEDIIIHSTRPSHLGLRLGNGSIAPTDNAGVISTGVGDLGHASYEFKDGHFSGTVYTGAVSASTLATFSAGIAFKSAATGTGVSDTSLTLDDYEEGTFTATINTTGGGTVTLSYGKSRYTRVGRLVTLTSLIIVGSVSTSPAPTGTVQIGGFPFPVNAHTDGNYSGDSAGSIHVQQMTASIGSGALQCYTVGGSSVATINTFDGTTQAEIADKLKAGTQIRFTITYTV